MPVKLNPSHQEETLPTKKSSNIEVEKKQEVRKAEHEKPKVNKEGEFDWTKIIPWIIALASFLLALAGFIFGIIQYRQRKQVSKTKKTGELEAEDEHQKFKERQKSLTDEECYLNTLREELCSIRILGSPDIEKLPVHLLDVFVSLDISETWRSETLYDPQKKSEHSMIDRHFAPEIVFRRAFEKYRMLLIIGEPGSGKTTLLKYYAMSCLTNKKYEKLGYDQAPLPIYFPLRELESANNDIEPLPENLARWSKRHVQNIQAETFYNWLHSRDTLILLDGLDEVSDLDRRRRVCEWIDNTATGLQNAFFVVASRWTGYRKSDHIQLTFDHLRADVRPFSPKQQEEFLNKWFAAVYQREFYDKNMSEKEWTARQKQRATDRAQTIIEFLKDERNKVLQELASVPMLLQIMAIIWKEQQFLPQSRSELFSAALKYLLDYRDRYRKLKPLLSAIKALRVLSPVSLWMQEELTTDEVSKKAFHDQMKPILQTLDDKIEPELFCENLRDRAGLIADYGEGNYIFRHKSFREYLAGLQLIKDVHQLDRLKRLVTYFGNDWWEESLSFFISEADEKIFDSFMDAFFRDDISKDLDQKGQNLLQKLVEEAPQRKIDSLEKCLNDRRLHKNKKRYILDCLKTIGSKEALKAIQAFYEQNKKRMSEAVSYADEILAEKMLEKPPKPEIQKYERLFDELPPSFRNPYELNAEYMLIPSGQYTYSVSKQKESVPAIYFSKYPVTNKRYRRFIAYLEDKDNELIKFLPLRDYHEQLSVFAERIKGFAEYLGKEPGQWPEVFRSRYDNEKRFKGDDQPVVGISWYSAQAYCLWLSLLEACTSNLTFEKAAGLYRLPNEVEWEWAAAGRDPDKNLREYPWLPSKGEPNDKLANYGGNVGATTPVGRYPDGATPEGLMDMAGNVWEWMDNWYDESKGVRALRGGSWGNVVNDLRCSARNNNNPDNHNNNIGFRVVRAQSCPLKLPDPDAGCFTEHRTVVRA